MEYAYPISDIDNSGAWATEPLWEKLDEEPFDDADYVESPKSATGDSFTIGLSPVIDPGVHIDHIVRIRAKVGVAGVFEVEILQGVVVIKNFGNIALTTVFQEHSFTLPEADAGNITDYTNLRIRITAISTQKNQRQNVSWIRVDVPPVGGEEHSGSGSISGNGSLACTIKKGGKGSALKSAGGTLLAIGLAGMLAIASIVGGGSQLAGGEKSASVDMSVSGGGSVIASGEASEAEERSGIAAITGSGVLAGIGIKQAPGNSVIVGGGSIIAREAEAHSGSALISGNGSWFATGEKGVIPSKFFSSKRAKSAGVREVRATHVKTTRPSIGKFTREG